VNALSQLKFAIGYNLQYYRKLKKLTQTEVAERIEIDASTLSKYESGAREPAFSTLEKLAELYECHVTDFIGGKDAQSVDIEMERYFQAIQKLSKKKQTMIFKVIDAIMEGLEDN
jgi:transcriptional regulator with XRE-family HTH domain